MGEIFGAIREINQLGWIVKFRSGHKSQYTDIRFQEEQPTGGRPGRREITVTVEHTPKDILTGDELLGLWLRRTLREIKALQS
jgi:hypothetical protein